MPYVDQATRDHVRRWLWGDRNPTASLPVTTCGELNFLITEIMIAYTLEKGLSYSTLNEVAGVLANVADEYRRRVQHPYEDAKKVERGDVYDLVVPLLEEYMAAAWDNATRAKMGTA